MKLFGIYEPWTGSANSFKQVFQDNDELFKQARTYWNSLENNSIFFLLIFIISALLLSIIYFIPYNNQPGRHYKPIHWIIFGCITFITTLTLTLVFAYIACDPQLKGSVSVIFEVALGNSVYASILYFVISVVWCNCLPTNAYRLFKF